MTECCSPPEATRNQPPPHAWQRWAARADLDRLSANQVLAVAMIQCGIASTPEAALRLLEAPK